MWTIIFTITMILLLLAIVRQLIIMSTTILYLSKDPAVLKERAREEESYLFIKGLY